jgi:predicted nucleic acid-binding protein
MKLFLDANVLVSVLNKEYPHFTHSSRILSLADSSKYKLYTSPICLAIAFYFAEKKSGAKTAKSKMELLVSKINITPTDSEVVVLAIRNKAVLDLEDGLEYYSAFNAGCDYIITDDVEDFYFSELQVMRCEQFLKQINT